MEKEITVKTTMEELVEGIYNSLLDDFKDLEIPEEYYNKLVVEVDDSEETVFVKIPYTLSNNNDYFYIKGDIEMLRDNGCLGILYKIRFYPFDIEEEKHHMIVRKRDDECLYELIKYFGIPNCKNLKEFNRIEEGKLVNYYRTSNLTVTKDIDIFNKWYGD